MPPKHAPSLLAALVSLAFAGAAHAETSPYYIGASVGVSHDSNVFRLPSDVAQGDTVVSVGLLGGIDQPIGRQRVYGSAVVRNNRYSELKRLDNTSYGVNLGVDWATIEKLSGSVSLSSNSNLINYGGSNTTLSTTRNIERSNVASATVQYGGSSLLVLQAGMTHRTLGYSEANPQFQDLSQDVVTAGVNYRPSGFLNLGVGLRHTRGDYTGSTGSFTRNDVDLTAMWMPSGLSTVNARLSFGRQTAENASSGRDFSGATGYLSWTYQPTGKLRFNTWLSRDTGAESGFLTNQTTGQQLRGVGDNSEFTTTAALDASYEVTAKIRTNATVRTSRRSLLNTSIFNGTVQGSDTVNALSLGATYQPLRNVGLNCSVGHESRSGGSSVSTSYRATYGGCSVQVTLQ